MSDKNNKLIALIFDDQYNAEEARVVLHRMESDALLDLDETAVIVRNANDKVRVSQDVNVAAKGKQVGHVLGLVTAVITGTLPFILGPTVAGSLTDKMADRGITNKFLKKVGKELQPRTSALVLRARSESERRNRIVERLSVFGPKVLDTGLPTEMEREP